MEDRRQTGERTFVLKTISTVSPWDVLSSTVEEKEADRGRSIPFFSFSICKFSKVFSHSVFVSGESVAMVLTFYLINHSDLRIRVLIYIFVRMKFSVCSRF